MHCQWCQCEQRFCECYMKASGDDSILLFCCMNFSSKSTIKSANISLSLSLLHARNAGKQAIIFPNWNFFPSFRLNTGKSWRRTRGLRSAEFFAIINGVRVALGEEREINCAEKHRKREPCLYYGCKMMGFYLSLSAHPLILMII